MPLEKVEVLAALRRVKGPDLESNIVDLGLVSEIFIKDDHPYFSITIPANRAEELEQLRLAAEKVVADISGVSGVTAVLTAEASGAPTRLLPQAGARARRQRPRSAGELARRGRKGDAIVDARALCWIERGRIAQHADAQRIGMNARRRAGEGSD